MKTIIGELVPIERKSGVTLYGKVLDNNGKLGQFEVHSDFMISSGIIHSTYKEAEVRMSALIGAKS